MCSAQDAGDRARLLEAPSLLVLVAVLVSPWLRRQRWEACVALWAILARLIPPVFLARLIPLASLVRRVLPAILARLIAPPLARATIFPASCVPSSSSAVAPVTAVRATADPSFSHGSELLKFVGVVGVEVLVHTEHDWFAANIWLAKCWHCQILAIPRLAKYWHIYVR